MVANAQVPAPVGENGIDRRGWGGGVIAGAVAKMLPLRRKPTNSSAHRAG